MKLLIHLALSLGFLGLTSAQNINLHLGEPSEWTSYTADPGYTTVEACVDGQSLGEGDCVNLIMEFTLNLTAMPSTLGWFTLQDSDSPTSELASWIEVGDGTNLILPALHAASLNDGTQQGNSISSGLALLQDGASYKFHWSICNSGGGDFIHSINLYDSVTGEVLLDPATSTYTEFNPGFDTTDFSVCFGSMSGTEIAFTPEPSSAFLLGITGLCACLRRRRT